MRKLAFLAALLISCIGLQAQEYYINLHQSGQVIYQNNVNEINNLYFQGSSPTSLYFNTNGGINAFPVTAFDSITFVLQEVPQPGDAVTITYSNSSVSVVNPYADEGIEVTSNDANVTVNSTKAGVNYFVTGSSTNGSLTIYSNSAFDLTLSYLSLTSNTTAAINLASAVNANLNVEGICTIADGANSSAKAAFQATGNLIVNGNGTLRVTGNAKHGINADGNMTVNSGNIVITETDSDGIHGNHDIYWNGGSLNIMAAGSDGLDVSGDVTIQNGNLTINTTAESQRGIKVSGVFTMDDGHLDINCTGYDAKGIKADSLLFIHGGTLEIEHSGDISKGIKCDQDIAISGGTIEILSSGSTEIIDNDPTYCTAIKGDANILISGGNITINLPTTNHGGKGISCAGDMTISGNNTIHIETHGDGATYPATSPTDTYSSSCLRAEGNMQILSGNITLNSTGKAGKGIKVGKKNGNTYTGTYTQGNPDGTGPTLIISTTGAQIGSGGGGWPPGPGGGGSSTKSSAKGIKVGGLATLYGGTTTVTTTSNGAEGLESKTQIDIEGGQHYFKCYDDCINSKGKILFNGGVTVCFSNGNDAVDSNAGTAGAITIGNGVAFAYTTRGNPEEGFDCDNNNYIRITGTGIGISAGGSQGGGWPGGGGSGGTITNPAQGYKFYTNSYTFQTGKYYTLSNTSGSGGTNMVTFSFEANCTSNLALITATGMVSGNTYFVKYGDQAPTNPTTTFHGLYLGGNSSASTQAFNFTAQ
ncbi:MAG: carbohydrate-binding domain-containing protein [Bacteroidales bacterium]|nr:carbohydrate-binding domain-containing protein [Bacteroidales bacterium]